MNSLKQNLLIQKLLFALAAIVVIGGTIVLVHFIIDETSQYLSTSEIKDVFSEHAEPEFEFSLESGYFSKYSVNPPFYHISVKSVEGKEFSFIVDSTGATEKDLGKLLEIAKKYVH